MAGTLFSIAALLALVTADPGFVALPITRHRVNSTEAKSVVTNAKVNFVPEALKNLVYQYSATFDLGSGQTQTATIDTGSSDLWVYSSTSGAPSGFDPSQSTYVNNGFKISYVDGSGAQGDYYKDKITWGGTAAELQFAVTNSYTGTPKTGVFGISFESSEASAYGEYANYPVALKQQGLIESTAYSLYLNDVNAEQGTLLFGAVDSSRYTGELKSLDVTSLNSLTVNFEVAGYKLEGVLDSGTSLTYLPDDVVSEIAQSLGATWNPFVQAWQAQGSVPDKGLEYNFDGLTITIPKEELWLQLDGEGAGYYLTIFPYSQSAQYILLGDTFLRSAYVVYDLENRKIAVAQANRNGGSPNYQVITSQGIPGAH